MARLPRGHGLCARLAWSMVLKRFPPPAPVVVPFHDGRSRIYADMRTAFGRQLYRYRGVDPDLEFVGEYLRPGDVFIDGGAHVGMFSLVAANAVGSEGAIFAFEPNPATFEMLQRNVELNNLRQVRLVREALGEAPGSLTFTVRSGDHAPWSHLGAPDSGEEGGAETVTVTTLADSVPRDVWSRISLIKLDLEGAELAALRGMARILETNRPDMLIEIVPEHLARFGADSGDVIGFLASHGYQVLRSADGRALWTPLANVATLSEGCEGPNVLATANLRSLAERGFVSPPETTRCA